MLRAKKILSNFIHSQRTKIHRNFAISKRKESPVKNIKSPKLALSKVKTYLDYNSKIQPTITMTCNICGHFNFNTSEVMCCRVCRNVHHTECVNKITSFQVASDNFSCISCDSLWNLLPETESQDLLCIPRRRFYRETFKKLWPGTESREAFKALDMDGKGEVSKRVFLIAATLNRLKAINKVILLEFLTSQEVLSLRKSFMSVDICHKGVVNVQNARKAVIKWMQNYGIDIKQCELHSYKMKFNGQHQISWVEFLLANILNAIALRPNTPTTPKNFLWLVN